jgi:hypothetical protein
LDQGGGDPPIPRSNQGAVAVERDRLEYLEKEEDSATHSRSWSSKSSGKALKKSASMGREAGRRSSASTSIMLPMGIAMEAEATVSSESISPGESSPKSTAGELRISALVSLSTKEMVKVLWMSAPLEKQRPQAEAAQPSPPVHY